MPDIDLKSVHEAVNLLRQEVETKSVDKDKVARLEAALEQYEAKNVALNVEIGKREQEASDLKARMGELEVKMAQGVAGQPQADQKAATLKMSLKAMDKIIRGTGEFLTADEVKALSDDSEIGRQVASNFGVKMLNTQSNADGGFLLRPETTNEIMKDLVELSPTRAIVNVRQTRSKYYEFVRRTGRPTAYFIGEAQAAAASNSKYGTEQIVMRKTGAQTLSTMEELMWNEFGLESQILADMRESFAELEGQSLLNGDDVLRPKGILTSVTAGDITTRNGGTANALNADGLIRLQADLKTGYDGAFLLNRRTLAELRVLKDGQGNYLWQPSFQEGKPGTILGDRYVLLNDMPDVAVNAFPILFGDFRRGYLMVDGMDLSLVRDNLTQAGEGIIKFIWTKFFGGKIVLPEAIKAYKIAV